MNLFYIFFLYFCFFWFFPFCSAIHKLHIENIIFYKHSVNTWTSIDILKNYFMTILFYWTIFVVQYKVSNLCRNNSYALLTSVSSHTFFQLWFSKSILKGLHLCTSLYCTRFPSCNDIQILQVNDH